VITITLKLVPRLLGITTIYNIKKRNPKISCTGNVSVEIRTMRVLRA